MTSASERRVSAEENGRLAAFLAEKL